MPSSPLAYIFNATEEEIEMQIKAFKLINWLDDRYARGAYAYNTVETPNVLKILSRPVGNVIYFGGEAYNTGAGMGTVEAAFESGKEIAEKILNDAQ